jgi:anti-anti-sigma factor
MAYELLSSSGLIVSTLDGRNRMAALPDLQTPDLREPPRSRHLIDCAGAQLYVHARSLATVLRVNGEIDAFNADLVARAIRRVSQLRAPLILDLGHLDFLDIVGLRALMTLNHENQEAELHCNVVTGPTLRRLTRVVADHGLLIVDSVPEALQLVADAVNARDADIPS